MRKSYFFVIFFLALIVLISCDESYVTINQERLVPDTKKFIDDNLEIATKQIHNAILNYKNYNFDKKVINSIFSYNENIDKFKKDLSKLFIQNDLEDPKDWIFNDLPQRLACHGMKNNYQLMNNDKLFLKWFNKIDNFENVTDLFFDDISDFTDYESINFRNYKYILRKKISNIYFIYILRKFLLSIFKN